MNAYAEYMRFADGLKKHAAPRSRAKSPLSRLSRVLGRHRLHEEPLLPRDVPPGEEGQDPPSRPRAHP